MISIFNSQGCDSVEEPRENAIHWCKSYKEAKQEKKKKSSSVNKFGGKFMDVSVLDWGVIFKIHHMMEKIWWWGMITNGLKSPNDLYLDAKSQNMSIYGGYVTLSYNIILSSGWY